MLNILCIFDKIKIMKLLRLSEILREKNYPKNAFAEAVNVSPNTISRISNGSSFPSGDLLYRMSLELDIDIRDLFHSTKSSEPIYAFRNEEYVKIGQIDNHD